MSCGRENGGKRKTFMVINFGYHRDFGALGSCVANLANAIPAQGLGNCTAESLS